MMKRKLYYDLLICPGETLKEVLKDRDMKQKELSFKTGFSLKYISEVINGKIDISLEFANRLEYVFNIPTHFWMNLQENYDKELLQLINCNNN